VKPFLGKAGVGFPEVSGNPTLFTTRQTPAKRGFALLRFFLKVRQAQLLAWAAPDPPMNIKQRFVQE
jgi:hypothetical protein